MAEELYRSGIRLNKRQTSTEGLTEITRKTEDRHRRKEAKSAIKKFRSLIVYRSVAEVSISQSCRSYPISLSSLSLASRSSRSPLIPLFDLVSVSSVRHGKPSDSLGVVQFSFSLVFRFALAFRSVSLRPHLTPLVRCRFSDLFLLGFRPTTHSITKETFSLTSIHCST